MRVVSSLEACEWILYEWQESERIGRIAETGDPLTILHPGGDKELAEEIAAERIIAEWIPEQPHPEAGRGERGESITSLED